MLYTVTVTQHDGVQLLSYQLDASDALCRMCSHSLHQNAVPVFAHGVTGGLSALAVASPKPTGQLSCTMETPSVVTAIATACHHQQRGLNALCCNRQMVACAGSRSQHHRSCLSLQSSSSSSSMLLNTTCSSVLLPSKSSSVLRLESCDTCIAVGALLAQNRWASPLKTQVARRDSWFFLHIIIQVCATILVIAGFAIAIRWAAAAPCCK